MNPRSPTQRDLALSHLAADQEGIVAHRQLLDLGFSRDEIRTLRERRRLIRVRHGVYAVGHVPGHRRAKWKAALLSVSDEAALCVDSAAQVHGIRRSPIFPIHVLTAEEHKDQKRLRIHRSRALVTGDVVNDGCLRLTSLPLTLIDLAAAYGDGGLRDAVERMRVPLHVEAMRLCLERHPRRRGSARVKRLLAAYDVHTRSWLERAFLTLLRAHGLPLPEVNQVVEGRERDFSWRDRRLVVEADGRAFHGTVAAHAKDTARDNELTLAGWRPLRFSYERIVLDPAGVAADLRRALAGA